MKDATNNSILPAARPSGPARPLRPGFTLIELLVVISIIALSVSIVLPSMIGLFTAGAESQARTLLATMCGAARGLAIENQTYTAVWMQIDQNQAHPRAWVAVLELDKDVLDGDGRPRTFIPSKIAPRQVPGDMAYGQISNGAIVPSVWTDATNGNLEAFRNVITSGVLGVNQIFLIDLTTAVMIFGPDGQLTTQVYGQNARYGNKYSFKLVNGNANIQLDMANSRILWNADLGDVLATANPDSNFISAFGGKAYLNTYSQLSDDTKAVYDSGILPDPIGAADNGTTNDRLDQAPATNCYWAWVDSGSNRFVWKVSASGVCYTFRVLPPISAVTVFNYATVAAMATGDYKTPGSRANYLTAVNGSGSANTPKILYVVVNPYTGQLLPNE